VINRNLIKATLVAGALATGGAIAGIAGAAAAPSTTATTTPTPTPTQTQTQTTPTTPQGRTAPRAGHPCPHMGSGSSGSSSGSGNSGSSYQGGPVQGATAQ
jgi:hypothetical protein